MGWLSAVMMIGGAVAAPFTGGASLALTAAGAQMHASEKAAKAQKEAAEKALALQTQVYEEGKKRLEPYTDVGAHAVTTMGTLMGYPSGGLPGAPGNTAQPAATDGAGGGGQGVLATGGGTRGLEMANLGSRGFEPGRYGNPSLVPGDNKGGFPYVMTSSGQFGGSTSFGGRPGGTHEGFGGQTLPGTLPPGAMTFAGGGGASSFGGVRMRAPEGDVDTVPADLAPSFEAEGFTRI